MTKPQTSLPIVVACCAIALLSLMDALMKEASLAVGAYSAAVLRSWIGLCLIAPVWLGRGGRWPSGDALRIHIRRGFVNTFMALTFFYALTKLPLAEVIAISFIAPVISLYLAALLLGEAIQRKAIVAAAMGFIGTLVIVGGRIGNAQFSDDVLVGLAATGVSALLYAYNLVLARQQAQLAQPLEIATFHSGMSAIILGLAAPAFLVVPGTETMTFIAASALLTVVAATALGWAYARAEAQVLVPMEYSGFLWASLFGWLFFREALTLPTLLGTALIVAGCWIAARKRPEQVVV